MSIKDNLPTNKNFGLVFCFIFLLIFLEPVIRDAQLRYWSMGVSLVFLVLGLSNSRLLNPFNKIWYKFGIFLGKIISPIIMGLVFFLVVTPTSLFLKLFNKDILKIKKNKNNSSSYWIEKSEKRSSMKNQF
jgi:predicted membrane protein|tara:strand:- start:377 stop:769 length:393 start_codon:yes stop_codon:yes gene_type:complete